MKVSRKACAVVVAAAALVALSTTAAFAQDCFVVNRSNQGATQAGTNSQKWAAIDLVDELAGPVAPACKADIQSALTAAGLPTVVATRVDKVLLAGTGAEANGLTGDGKGIDHFEDTPLAPELFGVIGGTLATSPNCA